MKKKIIRWMMVLCAVVAGLALPMNSYAVTRVATNLEKFDETGFLVTRINPGDNTITVLLKDSNIKQVLLIMRDNASIYEEWEFDINSDLLLPQEIHDWGETVLLNFDAEGFPLDTELKMKVKDGVSLATQGSYGIFYYSVKYHSGDYKVGKIGFEDCMNGILEDENNLEKYECRINFDDPGLYYISDEEGHFLSPATLSAIVVRDELGAPVAAQMQYGYTKELIQDDTFVLPGAIKVWEEYFAELDGANKMLEKLGLKTSEQILREEAEASAERAEAELVNLQAEINFLRYDRDTLIREMDALWQEMEEIMIKNEDLNAEVEELNRLAALLEEKKAELESLNTRLEEKGEELESKNQSLTEEKAELEAELESTKASLAIIKDKFDAAIAEIEMNVAKINNAKEQMEKMNDSLENSVKKLETANNDLLAMMSNLTAVLNEQRAETAEKEKVVETSVVNNYNYSYNYESTGEISTDKAGEQNVSQNDEVPELGEETICPWWILVPLTAIGTFVGCWWLLPDWHLKHKRK